MQPDSHTERELTVFGLRTLCPDEADATPLSTAQRRLLERLALSAPRTVRLESLIDALWEGEPPRHARATIQNQVSRLRAQGGDDLIRTTADGYALGIGTDARRFREASEHAEQLLDAGDAAAAFAVADAALPLWTGTPFAALDHVDTARAARRALTASAKAAENTRLAAAIMLGRAGWALHEAESLAGSSPHDERRQALLARALALAGRRGDALAAIAAARRRLRIELGIDAGPLLAAAEYEILHPEAPRVGARRLPFVGREDEVRTILASLARDGVVRVHGEPGGGVSRVLGEVATHLRRVGVRLAEVDAREHLDSAVGLLRAVIDAAGIGDSADLVTGFPATAARAAQTAPLAIIVDDADAAGPSALHALEEAARQPRVVVLLGGHAFSAASDATDVALGPLSRAAVTHLAAEAAQGPVDAAQIDRLCAYTGGNALALSILLASGFHDPETLHDDDDAGIAPRLAALVAELLRGLDPATIALVERAAVAGDGYPLALLCDPADMPEHLVTTGAQGGLAFRHGNLREIVYQALPPARREELHAELGRSARAAGAPAALYARHLLAAGTLAHKEARAACRAAASDAARLGADADAQAWLTATEQPIG